MKDVAFIPQVVGVGEIAISDHRSSHSSFQSLVQIASEARIGGMLSNKAGCTYFHIGAGTGGISALNEILASSNIPITNLLPTHMSRSKELFSSGVAWIKQGGYIDVTARDLGTYQLISEAVAKEKDEDPTFLDRIICTSDAYGSLPAFDADGNLKSYATADAKALLRYVKAMYFQHMWPLENALRPVTVNPARFMKFHGKGHIQVGDDADVLILDRHTLDPLYLLAKGEVVKTPTYTKHSRFDTNSQDPKKNGSP